MDKFSRQLLHHGYLVKRTVKSSGALKNQWDPLHHFPNTIPILFLSSQGGNSPKPVFLTLLQITAIFDIH
jgi:hypothetical protein